MMCTRRGGLGHPSQSQDNNVPTPHINIPRELYSKLHVRNFAILQEYHHGRKEEVRQGETILPRISSATLENAMRGLEWDDMGVKVDVYLGRELNMMNDLTHELGRRRRATCGTYKSIEDVMKKARNTRLRAHFFKTAVVLALTYASETWAFRKQKENAVSVIESGIEKVMLGVTRFTQ
ncbi:hypothetical protein RB195_011342 [Necator americanus]